MSQVNIEIEHESSEHRYPNYGTQNFASLLPSHGSYEVQPSRELDAVLHQAVPSDQQSWQQPGNHYQLQNIEYGSFPTYSMPNQPLLSQLPGSYHEHRNTNSNSLCTVVQDIAKSIWPFVGFAVLILISAAVGKFLYDHITGIFTVYALGFAGRRCSKTQLEVFHEKMASDQINARKLLMVYVYCAVQLVLFYLFTSIPEVFNGLMLSPTIEPLELLNVYYMTLILGSFINVLACMLVTFATAIPLRRTRIFILRLTLESFYSLYLPIPGIYCWLTYFSSFESTFGKLIIILPYVLFHLYNWLVKAHYLCKNLAFWCSTTRDYASPASSSEMSAAGGSCAVCFDNFRRPIKLRGCSHIFCEDCLLLWLQRQNSCPLCRCVIVQPTAR